MTEEKRSSLSSCFVTLTYDEEHLPYTDFGSSVCLEDHKNFIKKLRWYEKPKQLKERKEISEAELYRLKTLSGEFSPGFKREDYPIRYYGVSEYGDKNGRVHQHYILFNVRDFNNITLAWPMGRVQIDECNVNTIDYVLKYMVKDHSGRDYENKSKEKSYMSKGLGLSAIDDETARYIRSETGNMVINDRGTKIALPRYYRKKFVSETEAKIKNAYINKVVSEQEDKEDTDWIRSGKNPDQMRVNGKQIRQHLLKNQKKRNHD